LDERKSEQVHYTFKQMCKNFATLFSRLVPQGRGELLLTGSAGDDDVARLMTATGVSVQVSFTDNNPMKELNQLSGGQKSLVALAFILSIQQLDPAPFYLLDEVDAALDTDHRRSLADLLHEQAERAQFVTTTFRPELLEKADAHFGVMFRGKASHVERIERVEASNFVQDSNIQS
jgi:structural maintenance of chromosome 3 (chondroitin sulfate proteoglycan 6)